MPVLAVKIENEASLLMNEFFDYHGFCYAISRSRVAGNVECMALEDFYECTVQSTIIKNIPVIFVADGKIAGWYRQAEIYRALQRVSVFLEGNICAQTGAACLLPKSERICHVPFNFKEKFYEVIESGDERHEKLLEILQKPVKSIEISYAKADSFYSGDRLRLTASKYKNDIKQAKAAQLQLCIEQCAQIALNVMNDKCRDIQELKTMYAYARQALVYDRNAVDGWYYMAMACEQLGFVKEGLKAIDKALAAEDDGDDLLVLKGHLLYALKKYDEAADCYRAAIEICPEDGYHMCLGQAYFAAGQMDAAYKAYKNVADKSLLEAAGINLKAMEKRWPFAAVRGFSLKELFKQKH